MDTVAWLKDVYGDLYRQAKNNKDKSKLSFEDKGFSTNEVKMFFEDLRYGDTNTYNKCIAVYPQRKQKSMTGLQNAINRYDAWYLDKMINSIRT